MPPSDASDPLAARLAALVDEHAELEARLADPAAGNDPDALRAVTTRYHELTPVVDAVRRQRAAAADLVAARELISDATGDERELAQAELDDALGRLAAIGAELADLMVPPDPHAGRNVIVEIRGAEGGEEANLFARDLYDMYVAHAGRHGLRVEQLSSTVSDRGGFDEVTFVVSGRDALRRGARGAHPLDGSGDGRVSLMVVRGISAIAAAVHRDGHRRRR